MNGEGEGGGAAGSSAVQGVEDVEAAAPTSSGAPEVASGGGCCSPSRVAIEDLNRDRAVDRPPGASRDTPHGGVSDATHSGMVGRPGGASRGVPRGGVSDATHLGTDAAWGGRLVALDGGTFTMGTDGPDAIRGDGEGPTRPVTVAPFSIGATTVTVADFAAFVDATGFATDAERFGWSFVFAGHLPEDHPPTRALAAAPWWRQVHGADWAHPEGPASRVDGRGDHPVVHVSRDDALAYCAWADVRLPTEAEWEFAARGGLEGARYPWGDELTPGGEHRCNIWQGDFPVRDDGEDGWGGTAPADAFAPNAFGLHNTSGNVWEWCAGSFEAPNAGPGEVVVRGGSFLCHRSYCDRYRVSARTGATPDSSLAHTGFRVARDV